MNYTKTNNNDYFNLKLELETSKKELKGFIKNLSKYDLQRVKNRI